MMTVLNGGAVSNLTVSIGDELAMPPEETIIFANSVGRPVANM